MVSFSVIDFLILWRKATKPFFFSQQPICELSCGQPSWLCSKPRARAQHCPVCSSARTVTCLSSRALIGCLSGSGADGADRVARRSSCARNWSESLSWRRNSNLCPGASWPEKRTSMPTDLLTCVSSRLPIRMMHLRPHDKRLSNKILQYRTTVQVARFATEQLERLKRQPIRSFTSSLCDCVWFVPSILTLSFIASFQTQ